MNLFGDNPDVAEVYRYNEMPRSTYFDQVAVKAKQKAVFTGWDVEGVHERLEMMGPHPPFNVVSGCGRANPKLCGQYVSWGPTGRWEYRPSVDRTRWELVSYTRDARGVPDSEWWIGDHQW